MSNSRSPTQEEVYLAFRGVFKGLASEIRRTPAIERHLRCHFNKAIKAFFANYDPDSTNQVIKLLLEEGIFASEARARLRFPSLFQTSAAVVPTPSSPKSMVVQVQQSVGNMEKTTPEVAAPVIKAIPVIATVPEIVPTAPVVTPSSIAKPQSPVTSNASVLSPEVVIPVIQDSAPEHQAPEFVQSSQDDTPNVSVQPPSPVLLEEPSPMPVLYLPFKAQHSLLVKVQHMLEQACFEFMQKTMPDILEKEHWDCAEAVELNRLAKELRRRRSDIPDLDDDVAKKYSTPVNTMFDSVCDIRHAAVHRQRVSARDIDQLLLDAEYFAALIRDETCVESLSKIRQNTRDIVKQLENNTNALNLELDETIQTIEDRRDELDRLQEVAMRENDEKNSDMYATAGQDLERALSRLTRDNIPLVEPTTEPSPENTQHMSKIGLYKPSQAALVSSMGLGSLLVGKWLLAHVAAVFALIMAYVM